MNPIALFIPYYGNIPSYISAFIYTAAYQKDFVDFYIISDDSFLSQIKELKEKYSADNLKLICLTWDELCIFIEKEKGLQAPFFPYKLCDYRAAYGYIFEEYTKGYEYWGYCDIDILVGDIKKFMLKCNYKQYDRIGQYGHYTIYKNVEEYRHIYLKTYSGQNRTDQFFYACKTTFPCHIDECGSNKTFIKLYGKSRFYMNIESITTAFGCSNCHSAKYMNYPELLLWDSGKTFTLIKRAKKVEKIEIMYIHFMLQKEVSSSIELSPKLLLTSKEIIPFEETKLEEYFELYGYTETSEVRNENLRVERLRLRENRKKRLIREFKTVGFRDTICNFLYRIPNVWDLIKHRLL